MLIDCLRLSTHNGHVSVNNTLGRVKGNLTEAEKTVQGFPLSISTCSYVLFHSDISAHFVTQPNYNSLVRNQAGRISAAHQQAHIVIHKENAVHLGAEGKCIHCA